MRSLIKCQVLLLLGDGNISPKPASKLDEGRANGDRDQTSGPGPQPRSSSSSAGKKINYFKRFRIANCRLSFRKTYLATHISVNDWKLGPRAGAGAGAGLGAGPSLSLCAQSRDDE